MGRLIIIGKITGWVKGSIIEPVVAIIILVMAIGMAFTILTNLNIVPNLQAINKANEMINQELFLILTEKELIDDELVEGGLTLTKIIEAGDKENSIKIILSVNDSKDKELANKTIILSKRDLNEELEK